MYGTYGATVACMNCGHNGTVQIKRGAKIDTWPCPVCQCRDLRPITYKEAAPLKTMGITNDKKNTTQTLIEALEEDGSREAICP